MTRIGMVCVPTPPEAPAAAWAAQRVGLLRLGTKLLDASWQKCWGKWKKNASSASLGENCSFLMFHVYFFFNENFEKKKKKKRNFIKILILQNCVNLNIGSLQ